jgi:hypothetical protein
MRLGAAHLKPPLTNAVRTAWAHVARYVVRPNRRNRRQPAAPVPITTALKQRLLVVPYALCLVQEPCDYISRGGVEGGGGALALPLELQPVLREGAAVNPFALRISLGGAWWWC